MSENKNPKKRKKDRQACPISNSIEYIAEGDLCPICGFAHLKKEPGGIIRCPVCGYGNGAGCT